MGFSNPNSSVIDFRTEQRFQSGSVIACGWLPKVVLYFGCYGTPRWFCSSVFDLVFDINLLSSTGVDCASSGPCLTATLSTPYEVKSDFPETLHFILLAPSRLSSHF